MKDLLKNRPPINRHRDFSHAGKGAHTSGNKRRKTPQPPSKAAA